jgi:hypothetical protein
MAGAANASAPPLAGDALPWRPKPTPSRPVVDNEPVDLYRETFEAARSNGSLRCRGWGQPMVPDATRITDGIDA